MKIVARAQDIPDGNPVPGVQASVTRQSDGVTVATGSTDADGFVALTANGAPGNVWIDYLRGTDRFRDDSRSMRPYGAFSPYEFQQAVADIIGDGVVPYGKGFAISVGTGSITLDTGAAVLNGALGVWYTSTTLTVSNGSRACAVLYSGTGQLSLVDVAAASLTSNHLPLYTYSVSGGTITAVTNVSTPILEGIVSRKPTLQSVVRSAVGSTSNSSGEASGNEITFNLETGKTYNIKASASVISRATAGAIAIEIDGNLSSYAANGGDITTTITNSHTRNKTGGSCTVRLYERSDTSLAGWVGEYQFGSPGSGTNQFNSPYDIAFSSGGTAVYVADYSNNRVVYLTYAGGVLTWVKTRGVPAKAVCTDSSGNVYIVYVAGSTSYVCKMDATLTNITHNVVVSLDGNSYGIATDNTYLYITNPSAGTILKLRSSDLGSVATQAGWGPVYGIEYLGGHLYLTQSDGRVYRGSPTTLVTTATLIGTTGSAVYGIATDGTNLFIASADNQIRKISTSGTLLDTFGSYGSGAEQLNTPRGITVDSSGDVWVADTGNNRLQRFDLTTASFTYDSAVLFAQAIPRG
jgi:sugar lactone lactonase YvrE